MFQSIAAVIYTPYKNNMSMSNNFLSGMMMSLVGARRSGKSTLIKKLLKENIIGKSRDKIKEENVFIICPTINLDDGWNEFPTAKKYENPDPTIIQAIINEQLYNIGNYGKKRTPEVLVILDDCADNNILRFGGIIDTLAVRGRHYKINVIVSSQRMSAISRTVRLNSDYLIFFSPYNLSELEQVAEQYFLKQDRKEYMKKIQQIFETPFNFLVIDNSERQPTKKLKVGWNTLLKDYEIPTEKL